MIIGHHPAKVKMQENRVSLMLQIHIHGLITDEPKAIVR